jgi:hypothetical protein
MHRYLHVAAHGPDHLRYDEVLADAVLLLKIMSSSPESSRYFDARQTKIRWLMNSTLWTSEPGYSGSSAQKNQMPPS